MRAVINSHFTLLKSDKPLKKLKKKNDSQFLNFFINFFFINRYITKWAKADLENVVDEEVEEEVSVEVMNDELTQTKRLIFL